MRFSVFKWESYIRSCSYLKQGFTLNRFAFKILLSIPNLFVTGFGAQFVKISIRLILPG